MVGNIEIRLHPMRSGIVIRSNAVRRPNLSMIGPIVRHPNGVAIDERLATKINIVNFYTKTVNKI